MKKIKKSKSKSKLVGQSVEIFRKPIEILGQFDVVAMLDDLDQYDVTIDGKLVTDRLKRIILKGMGWMI